MRYTDPQTATLFQIGVSTTLYWLAAPFYLEASYWSSPVLPLLAAIGLFRPLLSANLGMAGTRILGPTISSTLASTAPLFGVGLGVLMLAEQLSWEVAGGTGGIVAAVVILSWRRGTARSWPIIALLLPVFGALVAEPCPCLRQNRPRDSAEPVFCGACRLQCFFSICLGQRFRAAARGRPTIPVTGSSGWWLRASSSGFGIGHEHRPDVGSTDCRQPDCGLFTALYVVARPFCLSRKSSHKACCDRCITSCPKRRTYRSARLISSSDRDLDDSPKGRFK
ncbi:MAG: hypothetical protein CM1200mP20_13540 [Pseudomonadota bacterium]|nr:MAG: hypothetical protein CM1200mP20_13540 [Pseudomonadota bacterium]